MSSDKLNKWLTLAANVGVLIGLILLSLEIRHNTQTTQAILGFQEHVDRAFAQVSEN